jgi:hypothetical protein
MYHHLKNVNKKEPSDLRAPQEKKERLKDVSFTLLCTIT